MKRRRRHMGDVDDTARDRGAEPVRCARGQQLIGTEATWPITIRLHVLTSFSPPHVGPVIIEEIIIIKQSSSQHFEHNRIVLQTS